ncbi:MAG: BON domain-containing protein [Gemmatimonadaceae bacterium]
MRIVEIEEKSTRSHWVLWTLAGTAVGLGAGILVSERLSGRRASAHTLWRRARSVAKVAAGQWVPLIELALELRERWAERRAEALALAEDEYDEADEFGEFADDGDEELDEDLDEDLDEADEEEEEDDDEDEEEEEEGEDEAEDADEDASDDVIGTRVLEAFLNDPILSKRAVEIDADTQGAVFLHGQVLTAREVSHAVTIAGGVPGVTAVRQRIRVRDRR